MLQRLHFVGLPFRYLKANEHAKYLFVEGRVFTKCSTWRSQLSIFFNCSSRIFFFFNASNAFCLSCFAISVRIASAFFSIVSSSYIPLESALKNCCYAFSLSIQFPSLSSEGKNCFICFRNIIVPLSIARPFLFPKLIRFYFRLRLRLIMFPIGIK